MTALPRRRLSAEAKHNHAKWKGYKGGYAWILLYCGMPVRVKVLQDGKLDICPYHITNCTVVSRTRNLKLRTGSTRNCDWWTLRNRNGRLVMAKRTPRGEMFIHRHVKKEVTK